MSSPYIDQYSIYNKKRMEFITFNQGRSYFVTLKGLQNTMKQMMTFQYGANKGLFHMGSDPGIYRIVHIQLDTGTGEVHVVSTDKESPLSVKALGEWDAQKATGFSEIRLPSAYKPHLP